MNVIAFNEVETEPDWNCPDCGAMLVHCRQGRLMICAYHERPLYFRIDHNDRIVDFRVARARGEGI